MTMTPLEDEFVRAEMFRLWIDQCRSHRVDPILVLEHRHDGIAYGSPVMEDG